MVDVRYWIWLTLKLGPDFKHTEKLINTFEDAKEAYNADAEALGALGLSKEVVARLSDKDVQETNSVYSYCVKNQVGLLPYDSPLYPARLKRIMSPPLLLYFKGNLPDIDDNVCIATVGTRRITEYGRREAYTMSYDMAAAGAVIVSGLARGIDAVCRRGALDAYGKTVAVLGCGIDVVYPRENAELFAEIIKSGVIITEYSPATRPLPSHFPHRNRIISGLSLGTLVLEADKQSGALITAKEALRQGRDIFALPGKVGEFNSLGTNDLIKNGAKMVTSAVDVLEEYECLFPHRIRIENIPKAPKHYYTEKIKNNFGGFSKSKSASGDNTDSESNTETEKYESAVKAKQTSPKDTAKATDMPRDTSMLDETSLKVLEKMKLHTPVNADELVDEELSISDVMIAMTVLEINKFVKNLPGGMFVRE